MIDLDQFRRRDDADAMVGVGGLVCVAWVARNLLRHRDPTGFFRAAEDLQGLRCHHARDRGGIGVRAGAEVFSGEIPHQQGADSFGDEQGHRALRIDPDSLASGHANPETGQIVFQAPWCGVLMDHLKHPERADPKGIFSVQMFAHEAMHVRGELNDAVTECQAVQRHYRAALLLGIPDDMARKNSTLFYETQYKSRAQIGGMQAPYYSEECAPGKKLDEQLEDSTWNSGSR